MKFKVGDVFIEKNNYDSEYLVEKVLGDDHYDISKYKGWSNQGHVWKNYHYKDTDYKVIRNINDNKNMKTLGNMMKKLLDPKVQTLVKAGYINGDLELTEKGKSALNVLCYMEKQDALVALAEEELAEEAKK